MAGVGWEELTVFVVFSSLHGSHRAFPIFLHSLFQSLLETGKILENLAGLPFQLLTSYPDM